MDVCAYVFSTVKSCIKKLNNFHPGYFLLAGRVRRQEEEEEIKQVLEKHLKRSIDIEHLFQQIPGMTGRRKEEEEEKEEKEEEGEEEEKEKEKDEEERNKTMASVVALSKEGFGNSRKEKRKAKKLKEKVGKMKLKDEVVKSTIQSTPSIPGFGHVVMTSSMKRMLVLTWQAIKFQEPVLLVGETGSVDVIH